MDALRVELGPRVCCPPGSTCAWRSIFGLPICGEAATYFLEKWPSPPTLREAWEGWERLGWLWGFLRDLADGKGGKAARLAEFLGCIGSCKDVRDLRRAIPFEAVEAAVHERLRAMESAS